MVRFTIVAVHVIHAVGVTIDVGIEPVEWIHHHCIHTGEYSPTSKPCQVKKPSENHQQSLRFLS